MLRERRLVQALRGDTQNVDALIRLKAGKRQVKLRPSNTKPVNAEPKTCQCMLLLLLPLHCDTGNGKCYSKLGSMPTLTEYPNETTRPLLPGATLRRHPNTPLAESNMLANSVSKRYTKANPSRSDCALLSGQHRTNMNNKPRQTSSSIQHTSKQNEQLACQGHSY